MIGGTNLEARRTFSRRGGSRTYRQFDHSMAARAGAGTQSTVVRKWISTQMKCMASRAVTGGVLATLPLVPRSLPRLVHRLKEWSAPGLSVATGGPALLLADCCRLRPRVAARGPRCRPAAPGIEDSTTEKQRARFNSTQESIVIVDEQGFWSS